MKSFDNHFVYTSDFYLFVRKRQKVQKSLQEIKFKHDDIPNFFKLLGVAFLMRASLPAIVIPNIGFGHPDTSLVLSVLVIDNMSI